MTREDLIRMMGNEEKAEEALEAILENIKPAFVTMCVNLAQQHRDEARGEVAV